ncbi:GDP-mannose 4,6-dehydratase [bacterium]|nr:GDP-mannose 4,6-dehydratase [bacterium]
MSRYLITGATGFVGPHLANLLVAEGHEVYGLIRVCNGREVDTIDVMEDEAFKKMKWLFGDLKDLRSLYKIFTENQYDGVFHLAAQSHPPTSFTDPVETFADNVQGSVNLIDAIQSFQNKCRLMFCSTSEVYGRASETYGKIDETTEIMPVNPYGASKAAIDLYLQERVNNGFIDGFITRAFSHTGPRRGKNFSISSDAYQIARMMLGIQDKVLNIGNLDTERVVIDVRDCVKAYYLLMLKGKSGEAYNVGGNEVKKMRWFTEKLLELSGLEKVEMYVHPNLYRKIDIQIQIPDITKVQEATGWKPEIPLDQTMKDLLDYWVKKLS